MSQPVKGMDWIEELMFTSDDLLVLGFQAVRYVCLLVDIIVESNEMMLGFVC